MIEYLVPTTRGDFSFVWESTTSGSSVTLGAFTSRTTEGSTSRGSTITAGQTVFSSSFSSSESSISTFGTSQTTFSTSTESSFSQTLVNSFFLTTTTEETFALERATTTEEAVSASAWTTSQNEDELFFTTTETTSLQTIETAVESTLTRIGLTELTDTIIANVFDTVVRADDGYLGEYILSITSTEAATNWDGSIVPAGPEIVLTEQATIFAAVATCDVFLYNSTAAPSVASVEMVTSSLSYQAPSFATQSTIVTEADYGVLPNTEKTLSTRRTSVSLLNEEITWTKQDSRNVTHFGNTQETTVFGIEASSRPRIINLDSAEESVVASIYRNRNGDIAFFLGTDTYSDIVLLPAITTNTNVAVQGNSTISIAEDPVCIIPGAELDIFGRALPATEVEYTPAQARCSVFGTWGALLEGESGGKYIISGTTLSGDFTAAIGRTVNSVFTSNAREAVTLLNQENESFTISKNSITYTTPSGTSSEEISLEGQTRSGLITTKSILGGSPEPGATFVQAADPFVYLDTDNQTTFLDDEITQILHGESEPTSYLRPLNYLAVGSPINGENLAITAFALKYPSA